MNQILCTGDKNEKSNIKVIVRVFCGIIIVFALFFIVQGALALVKNKNTMQAKKEEIPVTTINSKGANATIKITHTKNISKVMYAWDNGEYAELDAGNKKEFEETIIVPNGNATLNVKVLDSNGNQTTFKKEFEYDPNIDNISPEINISAVPGKITIKAEDNKELAYMSYKWNDEKETKTEASGEDLTKLETTIDVKKGQNKLTVIAVDKSGNKKEESETIIGASKPKISVKKAGANLRIKVTDEDQVTKVEYYINGNTYTKENTGENKKEFEFEVPLTEGENVVVVKAYNKSGLYQTFKGKSTHTP